MGLFDSLFYNGYQRALVDRKAYDRPMLAEEIRPEIDGIKDYETRTLMQRAFTDAIDKDGYITLARVVGQDESLENALRYELDNSMHEVGVELKLGTSLLADHLLRRANRIAKEIKPGAKQALGGALG
jgi:hypothetical protein